MLFRALAIAMVLIGCGDDGTSADGGPDGDAGLNLDAMPPEIAAPAEPAPPVLTPCPEGWLELDADPVHTCAPWSLADSPACTGATTRFPGDPACARLGTECPADSFPVDAPTDALFVSADAAAGGDGSRDAPFARIGDALAVASSGDVVAIGVGAYDEALDVPAGVTLLGACTENTVLSSSLVRVDRGVVTVTGEGVVVRNLRIAESGRGGVWAVGEDRSVRLEDVLIEDVLVAGIDAENGALVEGSRVVIRRARPTVLGVFGRGLTIENGATVTLDHLVVEDCVEFGVLSYGAGTTVSVSDSAFLRNEALPSGVAGPALVATMGATLVGERIAIDEATEFGAAAVADGYLILRDTVVRGTRSRPMERDRGYGVSVQTDGLLVLERVSVSDVHGTGIFVNQAPTTMRDVVVHDVLSREEDGALGRGLVIQDLAMFDVERLHVARTFDSGILIGGILPSFGSLTDTAIVDVRADAMRNRYGRGMTIQTRSNVTIARLLVERAVESGVTNAATAEMTDLIIRDIVPSTAAAPPGGFGLTTIAGGSTSLERAWIEDVSTVGIVASEPDSVIDATNVRVERVAMVDCDTSSLTCASGGHALAAYFRGRIEIDTFAVGPADICGIHVATGGSTRATNGAVSDAAIGACIQSDAQAIEDLQSDVLYIRNGTPLEATMLPVPMIAGEML